MNEKALSEIREKLVSGSYTCEKNQLDTFQVLLDLLDALLDEAE